MQITVTSPTTRPVEIRFEGTEMVATIEGKSGEVRFDDVRLRTTGDAPLLHTGGAAAPTWYGGWIYAENGGFTLITPEGAYYFSSVMPAVAFYADGVLS